MTRNILVGKRCAGMKLNEYPQDILLREDGKPAGLFHLRITQEIQ